MVKPTYEEITPANAEQRLRDLYDELDVANNALRDARQAELVAQTALTTAKATAGLSPECPRAGTVTDDGMKITVGYRLDWITLQIAEQVNAYEQAKVFRQAATDYVKTVHDQVEVMRSLSASAREAYRGIGVPR